jgi:hypothetical protein
VVREQAMSTIPLTLGPLKAEGFTIKRSGVYWLREDGARCRPNEIIGYCNISLERNPGVRSGRIPFADEPELHVAFATRRAGTLRLTGGNSPGGYLNVFGVHSWDPSTVLGNLELSDDRPANAPDHGAAGELRLLLLAGRRMTGLADVDFGLLPGWHNRTRGWWSDHDGSVPTLFGIGLCDVAGVIRGNRIPFADLFQTSIGSLHNVFVTDHPVVPCAPVLHEQLARSADETHAIASDLTNTLSASRNVNADDLLFAGALVSFFETSPFRENHDILTSQGVQQSTKPDAVLLSITAEVQSILRHKTLGYSVQMLRHRQAAAGPAVQAWLNAAFEPVKRTLDDMKQDYRKLIRTVAAETGAKVLILNRMSTSGYEDIFSYAPFDAPMGESLANIASKEQNLMLEDLADECEVSIVDVDAIAADLGGADHVPDGIHQSGTMQAELRAEIVRLLQQP